MCDIGQETSSAIHQGTWAAFYLVCNVAASGFPSQSQSALVTHGN